MLGRPGLPVAERLSREGQERGAEEGRLGDNGSPEKEELVRTRDDEGRIAAVSVHADGVERPLAQLAEIWLLPPAVGITGIDLHVDGVLAEMHHHARPLGKPLVVEMTLQPGAAERPAHLGTIVVDDASLVYVAM